MQVWARREESKQRAIPTPVTEGQAKAGGMYQGAGQGCLGPGDLPGAFTASHGDLVSTCGES